jgi:hypothetical protein
MIDNNEKINLQIKQLTNVIMKKIIIATFSLGVLLIAGCRKDITFIMKPQSVAVTDTVSFSKDLVPIFTQNCALSGCHATGGHVPNLMADKAYNSLMNDPDYIDVKNPENSELYERLTGKLTPAMPLGRASNPSNINALVLAWIKQGAKKN